MIKNKGIEIYIEETFHELNNIDENFEPFI